MQEELSGFDLATSEEPEESGSDPTVTCAGAACCQDNKPTLANAERPTSYVHLGFGSSEDDIRDKFRKATGFFDDEIKVIRLWHKLNQKKESCLFHSDKLLLSERLTILIKDNYRQCLAHKLVVVAIVEKNVLSGQQFQEIKRIRQTIAKVHNSN